MAAPAFGQTVVGESLGISARMDMWLAQGDNPADLVPYGMDYDRDPSTARAPASAARSKSPGPRERPVLRERDPRRPGRLMRGSWGPIYDDGDSLGPPVARIGAAHLLLAVARAHDGFRLLHAPTGLRPIPGLVGTQGQIRVGFNSGKYLMIHGVNWAPEQLARARGSSSPWCGSTASSPSISSPCPSTSSPIRSSNYIDKAHAGLSASVYLPDSMKLDLVGYVDDLRFLRSAQRRSGTPSGRWPPRPASPGRPNRPICQRLSLDYTAVGPYMYTQYGPGGTDASGNAYFGADAYTNGGQNIGPDLDPDSDRITLQAKSRTMTGPRSRASCGS